MDAPATADAPATSAPSALATTEAEAHRAIVREMHTRYQRVYSVGGGVVLTVAALVALAIALVTGPLVPLPWVAGVTAFLSGMLALRQLVRQRRAQLLGQLSAYATLNALPLGAWRDYWAERGEYPFFVALLDDRTAAAGQGDEA